MPATRTSAHPAAVSRRRSSKEESSMRRKWLVLVVALMATLSKQSGAFAESAGAIDGFVTDQTGNPLRGVTIVAESAAQIGKGRTTHTNAEGTFHLGGIT